MQDLVQLAGRNSAEPTQSRDNLTKFERSATVSLKSHTDLVIGDADKGGLVVILDGSDYREEVLCQLQDNSRYQVLDTEPTSVFKQQLIDLLDTDVEIGVLNTKVAEYLMVDSPIVLIFHHMPKLHKNTIPVQGRPIVAGISSLFEKLGHWIDQIKYKMQSVQKYQYQMQAEHCRYSPKSEYKI